ncbi:MAG: M10 family metallopeptidase, partial [Planktomarina sp.]
MKIAPELADVLDSGRSLNTYDPIKVYFVPDGGTWYENGQVLTSSGWNSYEIQQAMLALQQWSNVADIQFVQTAHQNTADFVIGTKNISGSTIGYFYLPGNYQEAGIGAFDNTYRGWSSQPGGGLEPGGNGFNLMLHEFGHGIGLSHPHSDSVMPGAFPGVSSSYDSGNFGLNQGVTTVMSYIDGWSTGPLGQTTSYTYGSASTPMPLDIAVVQDIYGANTTFASGNDTYTLPSTNQVGTSFSAIWDTGGIDTIVNPSDTAATIDLRPATLQVEAGGGGFVSHVTGIYGGLTIANSVVIENAVGGGGQ